MNPSTSLLVAVLGILVISTFLFYRPGITPPIESTPTAVLLNDVYPLYPNAQWGEVEPGVYNQFSGAQVSALGATNVDTIATVDEPFEQYYAQKLTSLGWVVDNSLAAGGPGAEIVGYQKGNERIIVSFHTNFKGTPPNAPVQCPCDVTLSLFTGSAAQ